jgi:hypothetical protein
MIAASGFSGNSLGVFGTCAMNQIRPPSHKKNMSRKLKDIFLRRPRGVIAFV